MGWFDDLQTRVSQATGFEVDDIKSFINSRIVEPTVKNALPQAGNQTAADIAKGILGSGGGLAASASTQAQNQNTQQASQIAVKAATNVLPIIAIGALAYFLLSQKSRG